MTVSCGTFGVHLVWIFDNKFGDWPRTAFHAGLKIALIGNDFSLAIEKDFAKPSN